MCVVIVVNIYRSHFYNDIIITNNGPSGWAIKYAGISYFFLL
jgi:hypothetical protein